MLGLWGVVLCFSRTMACPAFSLSYSQGVYKGPQADGLIMVCVPHKRPPARHAGPLIRKTQVRIQALPLTHSITLSKSLNFPEPWFPHLENGMEL